MNRQNEPSSSKDTICDIIIPVYNSLSYLRDCLDSVISHTADIPYRLFIIDDMSDTHVREYLRNFVDSHPRSTLIENEERKGFLKNCNLGMETGASPFLLLLNSDVIVTPGWLKKLIACAQSDDSIATVNPLTNFASNINIKIAPGANYLGMNDYIERHSKRTYPDIITCVGFCLLIRRSALDDVGYFDEIYGAGYCEESDLGMRLVMNGYRTVIADDTYVYHKGRASFVSRGERFKRNYKIFLERWGGRYRRLFRKFLAGDPLKYIRELFETNRAFHPRNFIWVNGKAVMARIRNKKWIAAALFPLRSLKHFGNFLLPIADREYVKKLSRPAPLRVTYILERMSLAGGVLSVVQLVNGLIQQGIEARIVTLLKYPEVENWKFLTEPIVYRDMDELFDNFPESDIVVATLWLTATWIPTIQKTFPSIVPVYFLQDYESWFFPESEPEKREDVIKTYDLIDHKIVKSDWLTGMIAKHGHDTKKIRLGMDLDIFYPRDVQKRNRKVVLAMTRPRTARRGFSTTIETLHRVKQQMPGVEIVLYGDNRLSRQEIPFEYRDEGVVTNQEALARLYSEADIFFDGSDFQGFGRTALEAMACGTPVVVTNVGGVNEYAHHMENSLMIPPKDPAASADAIVSLAQNDALWSDFRKNGIETAQLFCHRREAVETAEYFSGLVSKGRQS